MSQLSVADFHDIYIQDWGSISFRTSRTVISTRHLQRQHL